MFVASLLLGVTPSRAAAAETETHPAPLALSDAEKAARETWRLQMVHAPREKGACYTATYPDTTWHEVPCKPAPDRRFPPHPGPASDLVGNGKVDYVAQPANTIALAEGSFDTVSTSSVATAGAGSGGSNGANLFSLQLNSDYIKTSQCTAALGPKCRGWVQFVYDNGAQDAYVQYWLLNYDFTAFTAACPGAWQPDVGYCVQSAPTSSQAFAAQATASDLADITVTGQPGVGVTVSWFGAAPPTLISAPDTGIIPEIGAEWADAEFNVFGDGGAGEAVFSGTTTIKVRTQVDTGINIVPICILTSYTGETNNLNLISTPTMEPRKKYPSIIFDEGNAATPASCATALGDPHITTFDGLYYNFYVTGDYVLADAGPDFIVQARQELGAKVFNNPNVSMNTAVAVKMGSNRVLIYDSPEQVVVNGKTTVVADNEIVNLPGGVYLMRVGQDYAVTSETGDLVSATLYNGYMNLGVGLGQRARSSAHGILASPSQTALSLRDGTVLKEPVSLNDLNVRFAQSWLVQPSESLFPDHPIAYSAPGKEFTAADLDPEAAALAREACVAAGVTDAAHLDSCTLDTAVFKTTLAINAFTHAITPRTTLKLAEHP